jgi:hypothetical protein
MPEQFAFAVAKELNSVLLAWCVEDDLRCALFAQNRLPGELNVRPLSIDSRVEQRATTKAKRLLTYVAPANSANRRNYFSMRRSAMAFIRLSP